MIHLEQGGLTLVGALQRYNLAWKALIKEYKLQDFADYAQATTVSWKVADKAKLFFNLESLGQYAEQMHVGTVNNRYIASVVLHKPLEANIWLIKILERRAGSRDALGLDSIDYLVPDIEQTYTGLKAAGLYVVKEHNDKHAWLSLRFGRDDEFEAKFTDHLVLDVAQKELRDGEAQILKRLGA
jgi:hypothetical protein